MLPEGIPTVRLTGRFLFPDGRPLSGQVVVRAPSLITFGAYDVILGGPVTVPLDATGAFEVELPATNAPGMNPSSWSYTVAEQLAGVSMNRVYQVLLPAETPEVDLADIAPTDPSTPNYVAVRGDSAYEIAVKNGFVGTVAQWLASLIGAQGTAGAPGVVQSVNGKSQTAVVLAAADVGAVANTGGYSRMDGTLHVVYAGTQADAFKVSDTAQSKYTAVNKSAELVTNATATFSDARIGGGVATFGGGAGGILAFANAATVPTSNPVGALLYAEGGTLKVRQADGTVFALATAPVTSVNAKTGAVTLAAADVGAATAAHTHTAADVGAVATGTAVLLTGAQTVAGNKTFSGNVIVQGVGQTQAIVKAADTSRTSTVTAAADTHLTLPVVASATYIVEAVLVWTNGGGGFRADWSAPSGATMVWTDNDGAGAAALGTDLTFSVTTGTTFQGALVMSTTAGSLTLRWAQNTSDAAATVLLAGCYLKLERVA